MLWSSSFERDLEREPTPGLGLFPLFLYRGLTLALGLLPQNLRREPTPALHLVPLFLHCDRELIPALGLVPLFL
jgi:hypothetical protein